MASKVVGNLCSKPVDDIDNLMKKNSIFFCNEVFFTDELKQGWQISDSQTGSSSGLAGTFIWESRDINM